MSHIIAPAPPDADWLFWSILQAGLPLAIKPRPSDDELDARGPSPEFPEYALDAGGLVLCRSWDRFEVEARLAEESSAVLIERTGNAWAWTEVAR
jgi:hypothetical protein